MVRRIVRAQRRCGIRPTSNAHQTANAAVSVSEPVRRHCLVSVLSCFTLGRVPSALPPLRMLFMILATPIGVVIIVEQLFGSRSTLIKLKFVHDVVFSSAQIHRAHIAFLEET